VGGRVPRSLLSALVISANRAVSCDALAQIIWNGKPPLTARSTLQSHVSKLRTILGRDAIHRDGGAYRLVATCRQIDACEFERLVSEAELALAEQPGQARAAVAQGLAMWRGAPFGDLVDEEFINLEARRLDELRLAAEEIALEADLELDRHADVIPGLRASVADQPYREHRWYLLMRALAEVGRRVEALRAHQELCDLLGELGLGPAPELNRLAESIALGVALDDGTQHDLRGE
jgi:DNA-binding SARP family transcriptional activator